jgi:hypothetical protein
MRTINARGKVSPRHDRVIGQELCARPSSNTDNPRREGAISIIFDAVASVLLYLWMDGKSMNRRIEHLRLKHGANETDHDSGNQNTYSLEQSVPQLVEWQAVAHPDALPPGSAS